MLTSSILRGIVVLLFGVLGSEFNITEPIHSAFGVTYVLTHNEGAGRVGEEIGIIINIFNLHLEGTQVRCVKFQHSQHYTPLQVSSSILEVNYDCHTFLNLKPLSTLNKIHPPTRHTYPPLSETNLEPSTPGPTMTCSIHLWTSSFLDAPTHPLWPNVNTPLRPLQGILSHPLNPCEITQLLYPYTSNF